MRTHLKRHHQITIKKALSKNQAIIQQQLRQLYQQAKSNGKAKQFDTKVLKACFDKLVITKALISLIIVRNLSFALVE